MKNCISFLRRVLAHVTPVPFLVGALQHVRLGIVAHARVHDCQVLHSGDYRFSLSAASGGRCHVAGTFLCQDFDIHVVALTVHLFSLEGGLLDITFSVRQLGLERSHRVNGSFVLTPCVSTSSSVCLNILPRSVGFSSLVIETDQLISGRHDVLPSITVQ